MRIITFFKHETPINQVTLLRDALRPHLSWHGARLSFLAAFLIALFWVKTVNFSNGYTNSNQLPLKSMDAQPKAFFGMPLTNCETLFSNWSKEWMIFWSFYNFCPVLSSVPIN